jgi:hypothetical protein
MAAGILKHDEIGSRPVSPGIERGAERDQSLYLGLRIGRIEVQVNPTAACWGSIPPLKR